MPKRILIAVEICEYGSVAVCSAVQLACSTIYGGIPSSTILKLGCILYTHKYRTVFEREMSRLLAQLWRTSGRCPRSGEKPYHIITTSIVDFRIRIFFWAEHSVCTYLIFVSRQPSKRTTVVGGLREHKDSATNFHFYTVWKTRVRYLDI